MNDWEDIDRHLGPLEPDPANETAPGEPTAPSGAPRIFAVPTPIQAQGAPTSSNVIAPLETLGPVVLPAVVTEPPRADDEWAGEWCDEDEFNPRYCTVCHRKIPRIVSERQEMCNACLAARGVLPQRLPVTGAPFEAPGGVVVYCPMCASTDVQREWKNDWVSSAVDLVSDAAALGTMLLGTIQRGSTVGMDWNRDVGKVKVMRHRCLSCGHKWVE